ncbi:MAG: lamin tail domain-containing protein, partial [Phycisphaerales bacterium]|nr:lamin tail domain-containing protein [Phycisphaerales bacterium]
MRSKKHLAVGLAAVCGLAGAASADPANIGKVIITEIFANPNDADGAGFGIRAAGVNLEFIEIFNTTNAPIDISGWRLDDEDPTASAPFPAGTILGARQALVIIGAQLGLAPNDPANPGEYLPDTAIWTKALFNQAYGRTVGTPGEINVLVLPGNITIANTPTLSNEVPFIVDADGTVIDTVTYGQPDFPPVTAGVSLVLRPQFLNATDNDRSCSWALASVDPGSLSSVDTVFTFTPAGGTAPTTRDRLADAGNIASPGSVGNFGSTRDDNNNGIPDFQEICGGPNPLPDCNGNLILDAFEPDVNNNGIPDECEVVNDRETRDINMNNIPDDVDITLAGGVNGIGGPLDLNSDGRLDGSEINGRVIITEILVDTVSSVTNGGSLEWVEIQNVSTTPADIGGYRLVDLEIGGDGYTSPVPAGTVLQPGEVAVLCAQPTTLTSATAAADTVTVYRALWGATTPGGATIRWIPLSRWGARATNATSRAEILALIGAAVVNDAVVPANQSTTSAPHPTRLTNGAPTNPVTWVTSRGFIVDVANYSNTNSNG